MTWSGMGRRATRCVLRSRRGPKGRATALVPGLRPPEMMGVLFALGALASGTLMLGALPLNAQSAWPTTEWVIMCHPSLIGEPGPHLEERGHLLAAEDCFPDSPGPISAFQADFRRASEWLESLGFRGPAVRRFPNSAYIATIANSAHIGSLCPGEKPLGCYHPATGNIFVEQSLYFSMRPADSTHLGVEFSMGAAAHELFHGVTLAYPTFHGDDAAFPLWIVEGTAFYVQRTHVEQNDGLPLPLRIRNFSRPLHQPDTGGEGLDPYLTWPFWEGVGRLLGQPLGLPVRDQPAYLHDLFENQTFRTHQGLEGVDEGLRAVGLGGLHRAFPRILAMPYIRNRAEDAYDLTETTLQVAGRATDEYRSVGRVEPVAGVGYRVTVRVPDGRRALLTASVDPSGAGGNASDLHLVVDHVVAEERSYGRFFDPGEEKVVVVVANVAEQAVESRETGYELELSLQPVQCEMDDLWTLLDELGDADGWRGRVSGDDQVLSGSSRGGINAAGHLHLSLQTNPTRVGHQAFRPVFQLRVAGPIRPGVEREYGEGEESFVRGTMVVPGGTPEPPPPLIGVDEAFEVQGVPWTRGMTVGDVFNLMIQASQPESTLRSVMFADEGGSVWLDDLTTSGERAGGVFDLLVRNSSPPREIYHLCGAFQQRLRR